MKRIIAALTLALLTTTAVAGDYEDEVGRQSTCEAMGKVGSIYFTAQKKKEPFSFDRKQFDVNTPAGALMLEIAKYGYYEAGSSREAFMRGWAKCMDRLAEAGPRSE